MVKFLLLFPSRRDSIENSILTKSDGEVFVKNILMTLDRIDCERNSRIFFLNSNKDSFLDDFSALEDMLPFRIGFYRLSEILGQYITNNNIILIDEENIEFDFKVNADNFKEIDSIYLSLNRIRKLNNSDFRHCENHPKYIPTKSPLIGGMGSLNKHTEELLHSAIGDCKTSKGYLINLDNRYGNYIIRFEEENYQNQFHAFHIVRKINDSYIADNSEIYRIKNTSKGIPRAYRILNFRLSI